VEEESCSAQVGQRSVAMARRREFFQPAAWHGARPNPLREPTPHLPVILKVREPTLIVRVLAKEKAND